MYLSSPKPFLTFHNVVFEALASKILEENPVVYFRTNIDLGIEIEHHQI